jgi:hypothetical protein
MTGKFIQQTTLHDAYFDELEDRCGIKLRARDRAQIGMSLSIYERQKQASGAKAKVAALGTSLAKATTVMDKMKREQPYVWRAITRSHTQSYDAILDHLKSLQARCLKYKVGHRRPDLDRRKLLQILEIIFKRAGGTATGISRGDKEERHGEFLNFAHDLFSQLGDEAPTKQALAAEWEREYSSRAKRPRSLMLGLRTHWRVGQTLGGAVLRAKLRVTVDATEES